MSISFENFAFVKAAGEERYKSFTPVRCPYFNELVHFNAQGLEHLKFKRGGVERLPQDQYMRFKLLHLAPEILKLSRTVQGIMRTRSLERMHTNGRHNWEMLPTIFYEFIAVVDDVRVRVVVKKTLNGPLIFCSIIPFWKNAQGGTRQLFDQSLRDD
ncbi:MAG: hypothetical protein A3C15_04015 [Candidatus Magasanikbacteria bacterium RIFCSPHIGHO2_02_FULL_50_9b]|uniref:Uncharacterized protein n=1 Tax=Candidatus Magasanikbacteria bacterium RIFCSPHIGHO2_02_FULL_50_9b TaxID=1798682 RepID=A0A1F6M7M7_9BACT|nr:MAG: hypothetical protein A3C15_04015 [Candidatus Magasanikbacteria bacterium RIFCSPHIGHO2_02_FULL_50_9b]